MVKQQPQKGELRSSEAKRGCCIFCFSELSLKQFCHLISTSSDSSSDRCYVVELASVLSYFSSNGTQKKKIVCMKKAQKAVESLYLHFFLKILAVQGIQQLKNAEEYLSLLYKLLKTIDMDRCYR